MPTDDPRIAAFPPALRRLLDDELAAGNRIDDIASCHPAPPAGAWVRLAEPVTTRPRTSGDGLCFFERNTPQYSGEFSDPRRFHFILEPPRVHDDACGVPAPAHAPACAEPAPAVPHGPPDRQRPRRGTSRLDRFRASMSLDLERWRDGTGYECALIAEADAHERAAIEAMLLPPRDWRDIEALAVLDSERSRRALEDALGSDDIRLRLAVHRFAPARVPHGRRVDSLRQALQTARVWEGLTEALLEVQAFHPPEIVQALLQGLLTRDGATACSFAAMLLYLHGLADSPLAMDQRAFVLRFRSEDPAERARAVAELRARIGTP